MNRIIEIKCTGTELIDIAKFTELQGKLKDLDVTNFEKLKASILKYGFSFPVFVWRNKKNYILDAHQRIRLMTELITKEGYQCKQQDGTISTSLPAVYIDAKDKKEAKEKLLLLNSNYGKITNEGLYEFMNEPGFELDTDSLFPMLELATIDLDSYRAGYVDEATEQELGGNGNNENNNPKHECPQCGCKF